MTWCETAFAQLQLRTTASSSERYDAFAVTIQIAP
jgi:hypothetical protein